MRVAPLVHVVETVGHRLVLVIVDEVAGIVAETFPRNIRIRKEVEETAAEPVVVSASVYNDDDAAGPPVVLCRLPSLVIMIDPRDAGL